MDFIVYAKYDGCKNFVAFDLENGCKAGNIICASTFSKGQLDHAKKKLQKLADRNKALNLKIQLRTGNGNVAWESK